MDTFTLKELEDAIVSKGTDEATDAWVEAMGHVADTNEGMRICPGDECPGEHRDALTDLSERLGMRFRANGDIA